MTDDLTGLARALRAVAMDCEKVPHGEVALELGAICQGLRDHECAPRPELDRERAIEIIAGAIGAGPFAEGMALRVHNALINARVRLSSQPRARAELTFDRWRSGEGD